MKLYLRFDYVFSISLELFNRQGMCTLISALVAFAMLMRLSSVPSDFHLLIRHGLGNIASYMKFVLWL